MNFNLALSTLLLIPAFTWAQTKYTVVKGDTVLKIADKNLGTTDKKDPRRYKYAKQIQKLNPEMKNLNALAPGQTLILPAVEKPAAAETEKPELAPAPVVTQPEPLVTEPTPPPVIISPAATEEPARSTFHAKNEENHSDFIFFQPRYQMVNLTAENLATETEAKLKSSSSLGIDLQYGKIINEKFHILFQAGLTQTNFKDIEGDATSINHKSETSKSFAVGLAYEATHELHLDFMMQYADRTFLLPGEVLGEYDLESRTIPGVELNLSWDYFSTPTNIFGVSAIGEFIADYAKDGVDYKSSLEPLGALYWKSNFGHDHTNYKATLTYKNGHQKTSVSEQKEELAVLGVGIYL